MKYKNIPAALNNFGASFLSPLNYVDDTYIVDLLPEVLLELPENQLRISFPEGAVHPRGTYPGALLRSVAQYASRFRAHLESHNVDAGAVSDATLILRGTKLGVRARFRARDDRGREYDVPVVA